MKLKLLPFWAIILITSCKAIKPEAPHLPPSPLANTPLPDSHINVPVTVDLNGLVTDLNNKVPAVFAGEGAAGPGKYTWQIQRMPLVSSFTGNYITITDNATAALGGFVKVPFTNDWKKLAGCNVNITLGLSTYFTIANNYNLATNVKLTQFDMGGCDLKFASIDVAALAKPRAIDAINEALVNVNKTLNSYNLRNMLQPAWANLAQPIKIQDFGYLEINPTAISIGKPDVSKGVMHLPVAVTAKPVFSLSKPEHNSDAQLPNTTGTVGGNGFNISVDGHLSYEPLNKILNEKIDEQQINISANSYVRIKKATLFGQGNTHLLIKVKFQGKQGILPYHGTFYFTCLPHYDTTTNDFSVSDIDFDVNTWQRLKGSFILNGLVRKYFGNEVHFNLKDQMGAMKQQLAAALNTDLSKQVHLSGTVNTVDLQGILPMKDYILVRLNTIGTMAVTVH